jgi:hypothetical protein
MRCPDGFVVVLGFDDGTTKIVDLDPEVLRWGLRPASRDLPA